MEIIPKTAVIICVGLLLLAFILFISAKMFNFICFLQEVKNFMDDFHRNPFIENGINHSIEAVKSISERVENIEEIVPSLYKSYAETRKERIMRVHVNAVDIEIKPINATYYLNNKHNTERTNKSFVSINIEGEIDETELEGNELRDILPGYTIDIERV